MQKKAKAKAEIKNWVASQEALSLLSSARPYEDSLTYPVSNIGLTNFNGFGLPISERWPIINFNILLPIFKKHFTSSLILER